MKMMKATLVNLVGAVSLAFLPALSLADVSEELNYDFAVNPGARISLENVNGDITVEGWDGDSVVVRALKTADSDDDLDRIEILVDADDDEVSIETKHHKKKKKRSLFNWGNNNGEVEYQVQVPRDVFLKDIGTVNGDVEIEGVEGRVHAGAVNGDVEVRDLRSNVELETVNGDIDAWFTSFDGLDAKFESVNGGITAYLPDNADARVEADTVNGRISNDFGLKVSKGFVSRELSGVLGAGNGNLEFDTVNGSIEIKSQ